MVAAVQAMGKKNGEPWSEGSLNATLFNLEKGIKEGLLSEPFTWEMIANAEAYYVSLAKQKNPDKPGTWTSSTFKTVLRLEPRESVIQRRQEQRLRRVLARVAGVEVSSAEAKAAAREALCE